MKRVAVILVCVTIVFSLWGHEFWMQPEKYLYTKGALINIRFWVGENFEGENWKGNYDKVQDLRIYTPDFTDTLQHTIQSAPGDSLTLSLFDEGTTMFTLHTHNSFITLEAEKFNEYLKEDGLQNAIDLRNLQNNNAAPGKEYYQRSVKTIIQVGNKKNEVYKTITSLPLDIIPLKNPYALQKQDSMVCKILFHQQPLSKQLVKIWHRNKGITTLQQMYTNEEGLLRFATTNTGKWMVSTVKMEALKDDPQADWQSIWGSCTWGYF